MNFISSALTPTHDRTLGATDIVVGGLAGSPVVEMALNGVGLTSGGTVYVEPDAGVPCNATLLRLETPGGVPLHLTKPDISHWHRAPYTLAMRLCSYSPGSSEPCIVDEAVIGTRGNQVAFRRHLEATGLRLVRDAIAGQSRGTTPRELKSRTDVKRGTWGFGSQARGWVDYRRARWRERFWTEWWSPGVPSALMKDIVRTGELGHIEWMQPASGSSYLADPFPWPGTDRILCEEMPVAGGRGRIVSVDSGGASTGADEAVVLETAGHLSYPCTLTFNGQIYVLPEATDRGATTLYRFDDAQRLVHVSAIAPGRRLADPTLFRHAGLWWIACADLDIGQYDTLCFLYADNPAGPWRPHRLTPARIDVSGARPGGSVFIVDGQMYRPGQNCAACYGAGITLHRIDLLSPDEFRETVVAILKPDPNGPFPDGLHTLSSDGNRILIDGKRMIVHWPSLIGKLSRRLTRSSKGKTA